MKLVFLPFFLLCPLLHFGQANTDVFLFDLERGKLLIELSNFRNISNNEGYDNQPSFMDSNTILFASTRNGQTDILKYSISNGSKEWLCETDGSEYSPLKIPMQNSFSAIRLDTDGKQLLHQYDLNRDNSRPLMDTLVVGYHLWTDPNTIFSSVLEGDQLALYKTDLSTHSDQKMDENVGRSLNSIPRNEYSINDRKPKNFISYIDKKTVRWQIMALDLITGKKAPITTLLPNVEDMAWLDHDTILIGSGSKLYRYTRGLSSEWTEFADLKTYGITNITRLAVSPDGKKLAVVGELINQTLEPKLENIKWIAGNWKGEAFGGQTEEIWSEPSGGSMMAMFKLIDNGKVVFYEIEIIRELENSLVLQLKHFDSDLKGWESKDETVDFPLKALTLNKVIFEGMTFEKISDSEMNVYVDMKNDDGTIETVKFNYKK